VGTDDVLAGSPSDRLVRCGSSISPYVSIGDHGFNWVANVASARWRATDFELVHSVCDEGLWTANCSGSSADRFRNWEWDMGDVVFGLGVLLVAIGLLGYLIIVRARESSQRSPSEEREDRKRQVIVDLAHAHDSDDMALAVEIWRRVYEEFEPEIIVGAMDEAKERKEFWFGSEVDAVLKESWTKFVEESWLGSRGEFLDIGIAGYRAGAKRFLVEMAHAHQDGDMSTAIELWRRYKPNVVTRAERLEMEGQRHWEEQGWSGFMRAFGQEPVFSEDTVEMEPWMLERVIEQAEERGELWLGSRVDDVLKESWGKFVEDSYVASRDDFVTNLERGR